jgi:hypothetical protein
MKIYSIIIVVAVLAVSATCAAEVKSDYDREFDLAALHSFTFADQSARPSRDVLARSELVAKRLRAAIHKNLVDLGMEQRDASADFEIAYFATARNQVQVATSGRPRWAGNVWVDQYVQGTAIVEFRDAKSRELVWRGFVTGTVDPDKSEDNVNKGIKKLMERFAKDREKQKRRK